MTLSASTTRGATYKLLPLYSPLYGGTLLRGTTRHFFTLASKRMTTSNTVKVWHVTTAAAAEKIVKEGFQHPPISTAECREERQQAAKRGVDVRPLYFAPRAIQGYGSTYIEVEITLDEHITCSPGDTGALGCPWYEDLSFPAHLCHWGEYHLWPGAKYRILRLISEHFYVRTEANPVYMQYRDGGLHVGGKSGNPYGYYEAQPLPYYTVDEGDEKGLYVMDDVGEWHSPSWL